MVIGDLNLVRSRKAEAEAEAARVRNLLERADAAATRARAEAEAAEAGRVQAEAEAETLRAELARKPAPEPPRRRAIGAGLRGAGVSQATAERVLAARAEHPDLTRPSSPISSASATGPFETYLTTHRQSASEKDNDASYPQDQDAARRDAWSSCPTTI
jgi:regulator of protease activity HflC (stomatin/prohibitin superfamily)